MNELEEIKSKIDITDYIGKYVQLKQAGRNFKGVCPFHSEKTPSFMVSPEKQLWRCFGACNEGGDVFSFVQKIEGLSFPEAMELLAEKAGVKLEKKNYEKTESRAKLYSANEMARDFYYDNLFSKRGESALQYLLERGLTKKTIQEFRIGLAPNGKNELITLLKEHGLSEGELQKAGLAAQRQGEIRDFFWGRIIFPIHDIGGKVLGFSARVLDNSLPKYINTPETELYSKSNVLFGLDVAKEAIRKSDNAILVEGMMDVIASSQVGIKNVVAPGGTALTEGQLKLLGRLTKNLKLAFDIDFAGSQATRRAIEMAWQQGFNLKVIVIPSGKDAADAVAEDPKIWKEAVKNSIYVVDYLFDTTFKKYDPKDSLGKKHIAQEFLPVIKRLPEKIERDSYIKKLAGGLGVPEQSIRETLEKVTTAASASKETILPEKKTANPLQSKTKEIEENILGLLIIYPHYLDFATNMLEPEDFLNGDLGASFTKVVEYYNKLGDFSEKKFLSSLAPSERDKYNLLILSAQHEFEEFDDEKRAEEIYFGIKRLKKMSLEEKKREVSAEIARFEREGNTKETKAALERLQHLIEEERSVL